MHVGMYATVLRVSSVKQWKQCSSLWGVVTPSLIDQMLCSLSLSFLRERLFEIFVENVKIASFSFVGVIYQRMRPSSATGECQIPNVWDYPILDSRQTSLALTSPRIISILVITINHGGNTFTFSSDLALTGAFSRNPLTEKPKHQFQSEKNMRMKSKTLPPCWICVE